MVICAVHFCVCLPACSARDGLDLSVDLYQTIRQRYCSLDILFAVCFLTSGNLPNKVVVKIDGWYA
jgi:hypothetical protein